MKWLCDETLVFFSVNFLPRGPPKRWRSPTVHGRPASDGDGAAQKRRLCLEEEEEEDVHGFQESKRNRESISSGVQVFKQEPAPLFLTRFLKSEVKKQSCGKINVRCFLQDNARDPFLYSTVLYSICQRYPQDAQDACAAAGGCPLHPTLVPPRRDSACTVEHSHAPSAFISRKPEYITDVRSSLARTLPLRQRLALRCALPASARACLEELGPAIGVDAG